MRSEKGTDGQKTGRTFIETARRAQIVAAAIDTIAELGYGQASLARIAETAGTSKGVIIYHFGGKDDLIREIVAELSAKGRAYMGPRLEAEPTGAGMLRAYIEANVSFVRENRNHVLAMVEIVFNGRAADGSPLYDRPSVWRERKRSGNCSRISRAPASSGPTSTQTSWPWRSVPPWTRSRPGSPAIPTSTSAVTAAHWRTCSGPPSVPGKAIPGPHHP